MFRIGEVTASSHVIKACDVHIGVNKPKLIFVLHTSKTHNKSDKPQMVKIVGLQMCSQDPLCPFTALNEYLNMRKNYCSQQEQFFVFRDRTPVLPNMYHRLLKDLLIRNRLTFSRYGVHGMCAGRASDLLQMGVSVDTIKKLGRWKSNAVYTYL